MTTTAGRVRSAGPVLHPRICAALTAVSCLVHLWLAASGHHDAWLGARARDDSGKVTMGVDSPG